MTELHDEELDADARALLYQASHGEPLGPSAIDRQRMRARLMTAIAVGTAGGAATIATNKAKAGAGLLGTASSKLAVVGTVAVLAAGAAVLHTRSGPEPVSAAPTHASSATLPHASVAKPSAKASAIAASDALAVRSRPSAALADQTRPAAPTPERVPALQASNDEPSAQASQAATAKFGASASRDARPHLPHRVRAARSAPKARREPATDLPRQNDEHSSHESEALSAPVEQAERASDEAPEGSLRAELSLLGTAQAQLRQGNHAGALSVLAQHARSFPNGALREERLSAQALALCRSGQRDDGRAVAERLRRAAPRSPLIATVARDCK